MGDLPQSSTAVDAIVSEAMKLDRHGYLFGLELADSWSPYLHDVVYQEFGLRWGQVRLESDDVSLLLRLARHALFYGASVTMPNKVAVMPHLDELTDECRDVGACNTIFTRTDAHGHRLLCGANTDIVGIRDAFAHNVADPASVYRGRPALVIGGGGAARSAVYALRRWLGVGAIYLVNRDAGEVEGVVGDCAARGYGEDLLHVRDVAEAEALRAPGAIVACVPDLEPRTEAEVRARAVVEAFLRRGKGAMLDMCYNPTPFTRLGALAREKGWQLILGTEALTWQGLEQDRYWTGRPVDEMPITKVQATIAERIAKVSS